MKKQSANIFWQIPLALLCFSCSPKGLPSPEQNTKHSPLDFEAGAKQASLPSAEGTSVSLPALPAPSASGERQAASPPTQTPLSNPPPTRMGLVPGGPFFMGADSGGEEDEHPKHQVFLSPFYLDLYEVTHAEYEECVRAQICRPADKKLSSKFGGLFYGPSKPVMGVTQTDASTFCSWKGKRLPREAEFERAVRGEDERKYPWGAGEPNHEKTVYATRSTENVGSHPKGNGPYGHADLAGNVWEWMSDFYDPYAYKRKGASRGEPGSCEEILEAQSELRARGLQGYTGTNPIPTECERSIRGGAYNFEAHGLRSTNRVHHPGNFKLLMTGFRCAQDVEAPDKK